MKGETDDDFEVLPRDPFESTEGWIELGNAAEAMQELVKIPTEIKAGCPLKIFHLWVQIFSLKKEWAAVLQMCGDVEESFPDCGWVWGARVRALKSMNQPAEAEAVRKEGLVVLQNLARKFLADGNRYEAREYLLEAIELEPKLDIRPFKELLDEWQKGDSK